MRSFRCFATLEMTADPGLVILVGPNAQGKSSILEAVCVLARLQSPRTSNLASAVTHGCEGFLLEGRLNGRLLQFQYAHGRRKLLLDSVEQRTGREYLAVARVTWIGNTDVQMVRGGSEHRRRFLDFIGSQIDPVYRTHWRSYQAALKSRNALLKHPSPNWNAIRAFDGPLVESGLALMNARKTLVDLIVPAARTAQERIAPGSAPLEVRYMPGTTADFETALHRCMREEARLRMTLIGPHRDDLELSIGPVAATLGSEGQQKTAALALRLAQVEILRSHTVQPPILLIDDIFGELDLARRNAFFSALPKETQRIVATTHLDWLESGEPARIGDLQAGSLRWRD